MKSDRGGGWRQNLVNLEPEFFRDLLSPDFYFCISRRNPQAI